MISANLHNIAILNIHSIDYRCIINGISNCEKWIIIKYKNIFIKYKKDE